MKNKKIQISITISPYVLKEIDKLRGRLVPRSTMIEEMIERSIRRMKREELK